MDTTDPKRFLKRDLDMLPTEYLHTINYFAIAANFLGETDAWRLDQIRQALADYRAKYAALLAKINNPNYVPED